MPDPLSPQDKAAWLRAERQLLDDLIPCAIAWGRVAARLGRLAPAQVAQWQQTIATLEWELADVRAEEGTHGTSDG